ncbi:MAG: helix-turn-helix domain-containing protein [Treponema sp.]|nr:helix-turn-helix domain-containing protein [Treponema sp.]
MKNKIDGNYVRRLISNNVKRLRAAQNISQLSLAISTGLTHNFINDIENCKKWISSKTLAKLSTALDAEPHQLFLPDDLHNNEIMVYVKDFNDSFQKAVKDITEKYTVRSKKRK